MKTVLRHLGALALGWLAGGLIYAALPDVLAYPTAELSAVAGTSLFNVLNALVMVVSLAVWIGVYVYFVRRWARKNASAVPPVHASE